MPDLYDVILYGLRGEGEEREIARNTVARLLKLEPDAIEAGLAEPDGLVIQSGVTEQIVRKYQSALSKIGGLSRFQPAAPKSPTSAGVEVAAGAERPVPSSATGLAGGLSLAPIGQETPPAVPAAAEPPSSHFSGLQLSLEAVDEPGAGAPQPGNADRVAEPVPDRPATASTLTLKAAGDAGEEAESVEITNPYPPDEPATPSIGFALPFSFELPTEEPAEEAPPPPAPSTAVESAGQAPVAESASIADQAIFSPVTPQPEEDDVGLKIKRRLEELQKIRELHALEEGIHPAQQLHRRHTDVAPDPSANRWARLLRGLPLGAGAAVWAVGLLMGLGGGAAMYSLLRQPDVTPVPQAPAPVTPVADAPRTDDAGNRPRNLTPAQEAMLQLAAFAETLPPAPADAGVRQLPEAPKAVGASPADLTSVHSDTGEVTITGNALSIIKPVVDPAVALDHLRRDRTWPRHLSNLSKRLLADDQAERAYQTALAMPEGDAKWTALLAIADYHARQGNAAGRNQILAQYQSAVDVLDDKPRRIAALRLLAHALTVLGESQRAAELAKQAEALLPQLTTRAAKIAARGYLAALFLDLGEPAKADLAWQEANRIIAEETYPQTRLAYYIDLANSYTLVNRRGSAIALLTEITRLTDRVPAADQPLLLRSLAIGFARARDAESALAAVARMQTADDPQATTLDLIRELISQGLPYAAIGIIEHLGHPIYRTRAEAAVAWSLKVDAKQDVFARSLFTHATDLLNSIGHPADQAVAMGDVGRYQHWAEQVDTFPILTNASAAAQRITEPHARDLALALVAGEYARSAQWPLARELHALIGDAGIAAAVADDTARIMKTLEPPPEPAPPPTEAPEPVPPAQ